MSRHRAPGGRRRAAASAVPRPQARTRRAAPHGGNLARHVVGAAALGGLLVGTLPTLGGLDAADVAAQVHLTAERPPGHVAPVPTPPVAPPDPDDVVAGLVKAAGLDEVAARAGCTTRLPRLGPVKPWVRDAARFVSCLFDEHQVLGVGGRGRQSDHPRGLAVDFMTTDDTGDRIARCVLANRAALGVSYVIWEQRINFGEGWEAMEDRGSATENHFDHVHVSFENAGPGRAPDPARCSPGNRAATS